MADTQPLERQLSADILVVGGGISGMTTAIEAAEVGKKVLLIEKLPSLGGRVASMNQYFPKLCPPSCGIEINLRRIRANANVKVLTTTEVLSISGASGAYQVTLKMSPRYVNDKCTCCGECEKVCEIERESDFDYGMAKTKAIYLPHMMAYPPRYVVDPRFASDPRMKKCADACQYGAIDLEMKPVELSANVGAVVWATGWKPYDATRIENLGFGKFANVVTNVMMERLAAPSGPTSGRILRPSDQKEPRRIGFVQCAGSRDQNHLPYCSAVCCLASMKHATYVREQYPDSEVHIFYIDVRSPGRLEDFYAARQTDEKLHFHRGKVARVTETPDKNLILEAENTLTGQITKTEVDMAVLATGMVPSSLDDKPSGVTLDDFGFIVEDLTAGVVAAGTATRPFDVSASIQDATGAALKAILVGARR